MTGRTTRHRHYTEAEIDAANDADLPELLSRLGYRVRRVGRYYTTAEMDSLRVKDRRTWYRYSESAGGDAIEFLRRFHGMSFPEAVRYLLEFNGHPEETPASPPVRRTRPPPRERPAFALPLPNADNNRVRAYLQGRGIAPVIIDGFVGSGLLYEDVPFHDCVFVGHDGTGMPMFAAKRSTSGGTPFRGDVAGSDKDVAFRAPFDPAQDAVHVFEAPIDLMSWFTLYGPCNAVALCGLHDGPLAAYLSDHPRIRRIVLCLDADGPGREATGRIAAKYRALGYGVGDRPPPSGKDWNEFLRKGYDAMTAKADTYRQMADHAARSLTAQVADWSRFLAWAGQFYKYGFMDQVMIYTQRPNATACAEFDLWTRRMGRHVRRGSKGIALLRYRDGRPFVRYVFDVADTERREHGYDPVLWRYEAGYGAAVAARLEEAFGVPGSDGLDKQLITLAVRFADEHWHDFGDRIMLSLADSAMDGMDEDYVGLRVRGAITVSLSFLLLARCGFDLDAYFTPEDFACIGEFDTRDLVLVLGDAVNGGANVILRQVERSVKACMSGQAPAPAAAPPIIAHPVPRTEEHHPSDTTPAADPEKPAAGPVSAPEPETPPPAAQEPPQEAAGQLAMPGYPEPETAVHGPLKAKQEPSAKPAPVAANFRVTEDGPRAGGPKARYTLNVEAIRTLKAVEAARRGATPDEQAVLSRYVGWGGVPDAFDPDKPEWAGEYAELKSLLTDDEYSSARASVLNAHFTPPVVIRAIYDALGNMGFTTGNVLEIILLSLIQSRGIIKKCAFAV